jgi:enoyl-CoA hydratase/carnithine racemase
MNEAAAGRDKVLLERHGAIAEVILNRPEKHNAIDGDCLRLLREHLRTIEADPELRVVVVRGNGKSFCAGADLEHVGPWIHDPVRFGAWLDEWHGTYGSIAASPKPTIAAVQGLALAGGFELMSVCDFVVLEEDARIGDQHANFGLFPAGGGTQRLPRMIGERRAKWLLLSGAWLSAKDALEYGLANAVVTTGRATARAREMAEVLASKSPVANRNIKESVRLGIDVDLKTGLAIERRIALEHMRAEDVQIGLDAFRNRTMPAFKGR